MNAIRGCLLLLIGMVAAVLAAVFVGEPLNSHGFGHPTLVSMQSGGDGGQRHGPILWIGWLVGVFMVGFFVCLLAVGARKRDQLRGLGHPLFVGGLCYAAMWTLLVVLYRVYLNDPDPPLWLCFPPATAVMLFGMWFIPIIFLLLYMRGFGRWIYTPEDAREFEALLERARQEREERA